MTFTLYKIISKVLVIHINTLLNSLILENQNAFIPGHDIQDNIIIVQELFQAIKSTSKSSSPWGSKVALKLDMRKAYDKLH